MSKASEANADCELRLRGGSSLHFETNAQRLELPDSEWEAAQDGRAIVNADVEAEAVNTTFRLVF